MYIFKGSRYGIFKIYFSDDQCHSSSTASLVGIRESSWTCWQVLSSIHFMSERKNADWPLIMNENK